MSCNRKVRLWFLNFFTTERGQEVQKVTFALDTASQNEHGGKMDLIIEKSRLILAG